MPMPYTVPIQHTSTSLESTTSLYLYHIISPTFIDYRCMPSLPTSPPLKLIVIQRDRQGQDRVPAAHGILQGQGQGSRVKGQHKGRQVVSSSSAFLLLYCCTSLLSHLLSLSFKRMQGNHSHLPDRAKRAIEMRLCSRFPSEECKDVC